MQKYNLAFALSRRDLIVLRSWQTLCQFSQLVIMRGEQGLRAMVRRVVQVLGDGPGDRQAVERRRAAANFIKQHERTRRRAVKNRRSLSHLNHERRTSAREIVRGPDPRPDSIKQ